MDGFRSFALLLLLFVLHPAAGTEVVDGTGTTVHLTGIAERIVSLSPHATELLYAAGAGERVVGAVQYSDYPTAARALPRVGDYKRIDYERVIALKPDLVVGWQSGNGPEVLERLERLGFTVYRSEPNRVEDIASDIERLGMLAGTGAEARNAAKAFRERLADLHERYSRRKTVTVFYQVWHRPLVTVGGGHVISRLIEVCGGRNVFGELEALAPTVSVEAVLARLPDAIVAGGTAEKRSEWLEQWRRWRRLPAVAHDHLYFVPPDLVQRYTPRMLDGAEILCEGLEDARQGMKEETE